MAAYNRNSLYNRNSQPYNRNSRRSNRSFAGELIMWIVILGVEAVFLYLIHRSFGRWYNYKDTMPVMLVAGAFLPLAIIVFRYLPKTAAARVFGLIASVPLAFLIGMITLNAFYGENAPLDRMIYGDPFPGVTVGETASVTLSQYQGGKQVGMTVELDPQAYGKPGVNMDFREVKKELPDPEDYLLYTYTGTDGKVQKVRYYDDKKYQYMFDEDLGKWRCRRSKQVSTYYESGLYTYHTLTFAQMFDSHINDHDYKLAEGYNDSGKAVWLEEHDPDLAGSSSSQWYDRFIPEGFEAEQVEDVRYVFVCEIASKAYKGYWYVPSTGQRLSDSYDVTYSFHAYDLVTGEDEVLEESTADIFDAREQIKTYLEKKTGRKIVDEDENADETEGEP